MCCFFSLLPSTLNPFIVSFLLEEAETLGREARRQNMAKKSSVSTIKEVQNFPEDTVKSQMWLLGCVWTSASQVGSSLCYTRF